ncbi:hypothetical protein [Streptomyces collinus]|uniref:hypothetical protein n=1 Tax=Streptomyces collinus TaxID=42684 RepID=UPI002942962C|nr:hypothetical protein [Streptomyces collinus]
MNFRTLAALGLACAALLTGCATDHAAAAKGPSRPTRPSTPSPAAPTATATTAARPLFHRAPELDPDEILAGRLGPTTGSASFAYTGGRKGDTLILAVRCQGKGEVKVAVRPVHVTFRLSCPADRADTVYHQVHITGTAPGGTASVQAPSTVRWSMTIGRTRD